jgi:hypothetical protein
MRIVRLGIISSVILLLSGLYSSVWSKSTSIPPLRVLIVSPEKTGPAEEFRQLLEHYSISVDVANWQTASTDYAQEYDLVLVTGTKARGLRREDVVTGYTVPVLGIGSYGCHYFGLDKFKNGHPYT